MRSEQAALQREISTYKESATSAHPAQDESDASNILETGQIPAISILLEPGNLRAPGSSNTPQIPRFTTTPVSVILALDLARDEYSQYSAKIQSADGRTVREVAGVRSHSMNNGGRAVLIKFPPDVLPRGDYIVRLSGQSGDKAIMVHSYLFSVID